MGAGMGAAMRLHTPEQQAEIGREVWRARGGKPNAPWKLLENTYGRSRVSLWRYACAYAVKDVSSAQMKHLRSGASTAGCN